LHLGQHPAVGEGLHGIGDGGVVDQRRLVIATGEHVTIERVVAGVAGRAGEPAAVNAGVLVEDLLRLLEPLNVRRRFGPEHLRVALPMRINVVVTAGTGVHCLLPAAILRVRRSFAKPVIAGRDPAIHDAETMDPRVKPGGDLNQMALPLLPHP
jgi:hypothetical protein